MILEHVLEASTSNLLILSILSFCLALLMIFPAIWVSKRYDGLDAPLLKSSFSFFNVAFFGIPTVKALFGQEAVTTLICIYAGTALYGDTIGYILVAKSKFGTKKSIKEAFKIPLIYAFLVAIALKIFKFEIPEAVTPVFDVLGIIVSAAGMTVIGMNITSINFKGLNISYYSKVLGTRTISAVLITAVLLGLEYYFINGLGAEERKVLVLIPLFPIAASLTVFASLLESEEKDSALLITLSILISLVLVPLAALFIQ
ncbi:hypothetical protein RM553_18105 [Zunongwangia sp. F363]|uniref:Uncharacterized protein n=1 Tax=Autumnicola tepida TaxID=3075595 RepID=A0ABU3CEJ5_9FLAO|nr:hypothetical protein [Zunongwangia sp. F363]MDT0644760.1 hypothetical protein [Zunongwangia sp. F363]